MEEIQKDLSEPMFSRKTLTRLFIPLLVEQLLAMTVGMADTVMITSAGEAAVSAISLVDTINNLIIFVMAALATGGAVVVSQYIGRQDAPNARIAAKQLIYAATIFALLLMALCLVANRLILNLIFGHVEADVMGNAQTYFYLTSISFPFLAIYNAVAALFRSMGNSKISMLTSLVMNVINIGGNAVLIYVCNWGVAGAATATLASRIVASMIMLFLIRDSRNPIFVSHLLRVKLRLDIIKRILKVGIPNGVENCIFHLGKLVVQGLVAGLGTAVIAANAIVNTIANFVIVPGSAMGLAIITVVGQCVGAGEYGQAAQYTKKLMLVEYLCMIALNLPLLFFARPLLSLFNLSAEAVNIALSIIPVMAIGHALLWPMAFTFPCVLRAAGDAKVTMIFSICSMWVFRFSLSYVLINFFDMGILGVWYAMLVDWVARTTCFVLRYRTGKWKTMRVID